MSKKIIKRLKLFAWGFLTAIVVMVMANRYSGCFIKRRGENLKDIFSKPAPTETLSDTRMAELHSFEYRGSTITIESNNAFSFDESGKPIRKEGQKKEVIVENVYDLLDEHAAWLDYTVNECIRYEHLIKNQYDVYSHFKDMRDLYEEYIKLEPEVKLEKSKEKIYQRCYDYVVANENLMGGYRYLELDKDIQHDVLEFFTDISYMKENGAVRPKKDSKRFADTFIKILRYGILGKGRK